MRRNLIVPTLFAIIAVGNFVCPATGQESSDDPIWESGVGDRVMAAALSPDGLYGAATTERMVYLYSQNGTTLWSYPVSGGRSVAVSSGGERIAAGGDHLLLFDRNGSVIWRYRSDSRIQDIAITADGRTICTGADTGLLVFSLDDGETTPDVSGSFDANDPIRSVSIDSDGAGIVAGADSGNVYFLGADGRLLWNYRTGDNGIHVAISRDGSTIAAASTGQTVYLLNRNGRLLWKSSMPRAITDVSISGDGSRLVLADGGISMLNRGGPGDRGRIDIRRRIETCAGGRGHLHAQPGRRDHRDACDGRRRADQVRLRPIRYRAYSRRCGRRDRIDVQGAARNPPAGNRHRTVSTVRRSRPGANNLAAGYRAPPGNAGHRECVRRCRAGVAAKGEEVVEYSASNEFYRVLHLLPDGPDA